jgi:hypothetical protein
MRLRTSCYEGLAPIATVEYLQAAVSLADNHRLGMAIAELDLTDRPACCVKLAENYRRPSRRAAQRPAGCWWNSGGEKVASINVTTEPSRVILVYRARQSGGEWMDVEEPIQITHTGCHYGGCRPWFVCPEPACGRRTAILILAGRYFLCRRCYALTYSSRREGRADRALRRAQIIRSRLGGSVALVDPFPGKPKGMRWETYARFRCRAEKAEAELYAALGGWLTIQQMRLIG